MGAKIAFLLFFLAFATQRTKGLNDGEWSDWSPIVCLVTCGGGIAVQTRLCYDGRRCAGPAERRVHCNTFPCNRGISHASATKLYHEALNQVKLYATEVGKGVTVDCPWNNWKKGGPVYWWKDLKEDQPILFTMANNTSGFLEEYFKRNFLHLPIVKRFYQPMFENYMLGLKVLENNSLYISAEYPEHTGVWMCAKKPSKDSDLMVLPAANIVIKNVVITVRFGDEVILPGRSRLLQSFGREKVKNVIWYHNSIIVYRYNDTEMRQGKDEFIFTASDSHVGVWFCEVDFEGRKWVTAYFNVELTYITRTWILIGRAAFVLVFICFVEIIIV